MVIGFLLVVLILIFFLFEWRVALISAISIPLSLVAAGLVLNWTGATINTMILAGLVIALGVLVDDAIIDVENIVRRIRQHRLEGSTKSTASDRPRGLGRGAGADRPGHDDHPGLAPSRSSCSAG